MVTLEKTKELIERAYTCACVHGFHDEEKSVEHWMMLALSEVGEIVEADRKGRGRCDLGIFDDAMRTKDLTWSFKEYVKDSVPDEMADVCIRLYDLCGIKGIEPVVFYEDKYVKAMRDTFKELMGDKSLCERCYSLSAILCRAENGNIREDELPSLIGAALCFVWCMAEDMGIDLLRHIELKMKYNESREKRHGKSY